MKIKNIVITLVVLFFSSIAQASPVNINSATAEEIAKALNGIGIAKAKALVAYRTANGDFSSAAQIVKVKGIGQSTFEKNKVDIQVK